MIKLTNSSRKQLSEKNDIFDTSLLNQSHQNKKENDFGEETNRFIQSQIKQSVSIPKIIMKRKDNKKVKKTNLNTLPIQEKKTRYDYLYENSKILFAKREYIQNEKQRYEYSRMNPMITAKAKNIQRNPCLFAERLYPRIKNINKKIIVEEEDYIEEKDLYGDQKEKYKIIYHKNTSQNSRNNNELNKTVDYSFKPSFNKNSLAIASKLPINPMTRLTIAKFKFPSTNKDYNSNNNNRSQLNRARISLTPNPKSIQLYNKAMLSKQKKIEIIQRIQDQKEKEENNHPFKPKLNTYKSYTKTLIHQSSPNISNITNYNQYDLYSRNYKWKENLEQETEKIKKRKKDDETVQCTFKPIINKKIMSPTPKSKLIQNTFHQNLFVKRRQYCLMRQKEDEKIMKRKFFIQDNNARDNQSQSCSRNKIKRNFIKDTSLFTNTKTDKVTLDSSINQNEAISNRIKFQRNQLGLFEYFSAQSDFEQECINYFHYDYDNCNKLHQERNSNHSFAFSEAVHKLLLSN